MRREASCAMTIMKYMYPAEKLNQARRTLMAPHPEGETASFADAFGLCSACSKGLDQVDDELARDWIKAIRKIMETSGLDDPERRGLYVVRAEHLTLDEKSAFSRIVDELASWLNRRVFAENDA